jgi:CheY-like chemotaxis protein
MFLPNLENKKLLVVEDDDMSFIYLNHMLLLTKCFVVREKYGIDALELYRSHPGFDMIFMDLQLPDMDGKQVTREIRHQNPVIPIIAQTADRSPLEKELALKAGCTDVLLKPFSMEELFDIIANHLKS